MCAIVGTLFWDCFRGEERKQLVEDINTVFSASMERGRDGRGYYGVSILDKKLGYQTHAWRDTTRAVGWQRSKIFNHPIDKGVLIGNLRAEPTTEYIQEKHDLDQQPYQCGPWTIVHNGTIANDKDLRTYALKTDIDSAAIAEQLARRPMLGHSTEEVEQHFVQVIKSLKGSYAILAVHEHHPSLILAAVNYRPLWWNLTNTRLMFASAKAYLPFSGKVEMLPPYSIFSFTKFGPKRLDVPAADASRAKALVICSGGLDSTVAAAWAIEKGYEVELLHFMYGSRAEGREVEQVNRIADHLGVGLKLMPMRHVYDEEDSPLLQSGSAIAGGEAGAEFAHEWVPARNLLMLATATAYAEAKGFGTLVLGNNLEEAGAYPDNEPEFINRFNEMLPFAVGDGKKVRVVMPVGNMMKHEIVALGRELRAPMHLTWSCYRNGDKHCGTCGPCFMRRTAFKINKFRDIQYIKED